MAGLREQKKELNRLAILDAGSHLFARKGVRDTTIEEIARSARVGVGTVYNYFGGKSEILVAILTERTRKTLTAVRQALAGKVLSAEEMIRSLLLRYLESYFTYDRELVREAFATSILHPETFGRQMCEVEIELRGEMERTIRTLVEQGKLRNDLDCSTATDLVHGTWINILLLCLVESSTTRTEAARLIEERIHWLLCGWQVSDGKVSA